MSHESLHHVQKIKVMEDKFWPFLLFHENSASSEICICQSDYQIVESSKECACSETAFVSGKVQHQASWSLPQRRLDQRAGIFWTEMVNLPPCHLGLSKNQRYSNYRQVMSIFVAKECTHGWRSPRFHLV